MKLSVKYCLRCVPLGGFSFQNIFKFTQRSEHILTSSATWVPGITLRQSSLTASILNHCCVTASAFWRLLVLLGHPASLTWLCSVLPLPCVLCGLLAFLLQRQTLSEPMQFTIISPLSLQLNRCCVIPFAV